MTANEKLHAKAASYGVDVATYVSAKKTGSVAKFVRDRTNHINLGHCWELDLGEWLSVWTASGFEPKHADRKIMMVRIDRSLPYRVGNVRVVTASDYLKEARAERMAAR